MEVCFSKEKLIYMAMQKTILSLHIRMTLFVATKSWQKLIYMYHTLADNTGIIGSYILLSTTLLFVFRSTIISRPPKHVAGDC